MAIPNPPPSDISPAEFFESWLPAEYQRTSSALTSKPPNAVIGIELSGEGGGAWTLTLEDGALTVTAAAADNANIALRQSVEDWRTITIHAASQGADPAAAASIDRLLTSPGLAQLVESVKGSMRFCVPGLGGRDFSAELVFGGASAPQATVTVSADTLEQIRSGALPAPQAYFTGLIQVEGDPTLFMTVGMAFMSS